MAGMLTRTCRPYSVLASGQPYRSYADGWTSAHPHVEPTSGRVGVSQTAAQPTATPLKMADDNADPRVQSAEAEREEKMTQVRKRPEHHTEE